MARKSKITEVARELFFNSLSKAKHVLGKDSMSSCFIFDDDIVRTFDGFSMIQVDLEEPIGFKGSVPAEQLISILGKITVDVVGIEEKDGHFVVHAGKTKYGVKISPQNKLDLDSIWDAFVALDEKSEELPKNFYPHFERAIGSAQYIGINIENDQILSIAKTKCYKGILEHKLNFKGTVVDLQAIKAIKSLELPKIVSDDKRVYFSSDSVMFATYLGEDTYRKLPDFDTNGANSHSFAFAQNKEVKKAFERLSTFLKKEEQPAAEFSATKDCMTVKGTTSNGFYEDSFDIEYAGKPFAFSANAVFLRSIVDLILNGTILPENKVAFFYGEDFSYMTTLFYEEVREED